MTRRTVLLLTFASAASAVTASDVFGNIPTCQRAQSQLRTFAGALELHRNLAGSLPEESEWFDVLVRDGMVDARTRNDPWGHPYVYRKTGDSFDLFTVGADGLSGTADDQIKADQWGWRTCSSGRSRSGCTLP
jgi:hypothetical protein